MFDCIDRNGGYFLSRLAGTANPRIVTVHRRWRGHAVALEGKRLEEIAGKLRREELDVEVEVQFKRRVYYGRRRTDRRRFRLVGVREAESGTYRFYLTNIAPETLDAHAIAQVYAARWQVEQFFDVLKNGCKVEKLQLRTVGRLEVALALFMIVAWRIDRLMRLGRHCPEMEAAVMFEPEEIVAAFAANKRELPEGTPMLGEVMRKVAMAGGFLVGELVLDRCGASRGSGRYAVICSSAPGG